MAYRDRDNVVPITIPPGYEKLGKEAESIKWIHSQLQQLERSPTCKRVEDLRLLLQKELDTDSIPFRALDQSTISKLEQELSKVQSENSELMKQLRSLDQPSYDDSPSTGSWTRWIVVAIIIVLITVYLVIHNS